ncbi:MAG: ABC transporter substrate-binding protein [Gammaproteobacteria bacterium]|nr:ABC transporter substrate-binding protein [Gammaproteobacteria bacterium]
MYLYRFFPLFILLYIPLTTNANENTCPRIISQSPYISHMLDYLGLAECIVGVSRYSKRSLPHTGGILDPDAQAIDSLMPDLFITSDWTSQATLKKVLAGDVKAIRLKSFNSMLQLEENMQLILDATGHTQVSNKVEAFAKSWREKVKQVDGNNRQVLLLSSCSGMPYSFGPNSRLYDLFTKAGFRVVETGEKIRHIRPGNEIEGLNHLLNRYRPDLLFVFEQTLNKQCQLLLPEKPVRILNLDGSKFLHPSTSILEGLDLLIANKHVWH